MAAKHNALMQLSRRLNHVGNLACRMTARQRSGALRHVENAIALETMQNANQIIGKITYKTDFIPSFILDLCLYYILGLLVWFPCRFSCITLLQYISSLPSRSYPTDSYLILTYKDNLFLSTVIILCIGLFAFQFWLGFPGQITWDTYVMISLDKTNWFPVLISYFLEFLYILFGKHSYYLFLCNLIPFYIGLAFLVCGFYIRFRTSLALIFIFKILCNTIVFLFQ